MRSFVLSALCALASFAHAADNPYRYNVVVEYGEPLKVYAMVDGADGKPLMFETADTPSTKPWSVSKTVDGVTFTIRLTPVENADGDWSTMFEAKRGDVVLQHEEKPIPSGREHQADLVTIDVTDADFYDFLRAFRALSGRTIRVGSLVKGTVTLHAEEMPWLTALTQAAAQVGHVPKVLENGEVLLIRAQK